MSECECGCVCVSTKCFPAFLFPVYCRRTKNNIPVIFACHCHLSQLQDAVFVHFAGCDAEAAQLQSVFTRLFGMMHARCRGVVAAACCSSPGASCHAPHTHTHMQTCTHSPSACTNMHLSAFLFSLIRSGDSDTSAQPHAASGDGSGGGGDGDGDETPLETLASSHDLHTLVNG